MADNISLPLAAGVLTDTSAAPAAAGPFKAGQRYDLGNFHFSHGAIDRHLADMKDRSPLHRSHEFARERGFKDGAFLPASLIVMTIVERFNELVLCGTPAIVCDFRSTFRLPLTIGRDGGMFTASARVAAILPPSRLRRNRPAAQFEIRVCDNSRRCCGRIVIELIVPEKKK